MDLNTSFKLGGNNMPHRWCGNWINGFWLTTHIPHLWCGFYCMYSVATIKSLF